MLRVIATVVLVSCAHRAPRGLAEGIFPLSARASIDYWDRTTPWEQPRNGRIVLLDVEHMSFTTPENFLTVQASRLDGQHLIVRGEDLGFGAEYLFVVAAVPAPPE